MHATPLTISAEELNAGIATFNELAPDTDIITKSGVIQRVRFRLVSMD